MLLLACSGEPNEPVSPPKTGPEPISEAIVSASWPVKVAAPGALDTLLSNPGWQSYYERNYSGALTGFGASGPATARLHAEISAMYRQAALLQARSTIETYRPEQIREGDPAEVSYVLAVAWMVVNETEKAKELLGKSGGSPSKALASPDAAWAKRLAQPDARWWPISNDPAQFPLAEVTAGVMPGIADAPHYTVKERPLDGGSTPLDVGLSDATALLQAAMWHEAAASAALAGDVSVADALLGPWRLPGEPLNTVASGEVKELPLEALFMSPWLTTADLQLVVGLNAGKPATEWLQQLSATSAYAVVISRCVVEQKVDPNCLQDQAIALSQQVEAAMGKTFGSASADHRLFAQFVLAGTLRAGAEVAESFGDERGAAELRLIARDRSVDAAADPTFFISIAAWDAGQRNPVRAQELFHGYVDKLPGLQAARVSLDALNLRVSRDAGPAIPVH